MALYHHLLGFPSSLQLKEEYNRLLTYTVHAKESSKNDRYGIINLPKVIKFIKEDIIEIETKDNIKADKVLIRIPYDKQFDLCLSIVLDSSTVKTVWLNNKKDKHFTLKRDKYDRL